MIVVHHRTYQHLNEDWDVEWEVTVSRANESISLRLGQQRFLWPATGIVWRGPRWTDWPR